MKKLKFGLLTIVSLIMFNSAITSCSRDDNNNPETTQTIEQKRSIPTLQLGVTPADLEFVGIEHNQMLESTYNYLKNNGATKQNAKDLAENHLITAITNNRKYSKESNQLGVDYVKNIFDNPIPSPMVIYSSEAAMHLSTKEKMYLDQLSAILDAPFTSVNDIVSKITLLEGNIQQDSRLTENQLVTLYSSTQVARYSAQYWLTNNNAQKWFQLTHPGMMLRTDPGEIAGSIVKADISGGAGAAVGAFIVNAVPGAGQVAYGGAILGGAVGASAGMAINHLLDAIWF